MQTPALKELRKNCRLTQVEAARRLGVSQAYLSLLENDGRPLRQKLLRKAVRVFKAPPTVLPPSTILDRNVEDDRLAKELATLGYPGFGYLRSGRQRNPAEVLMTALVKPELDPRVTEALPWLVLAYPHLDQKWLVTQARVLNLSNRLGFVVDLARQVAENSGEGSSAAPFLDELVSEVKAGRLDVEGTLCQDSLSEKERKWLRENRSELARYWHLLTNWRPE